MRDAPNVTSVSAHMEIIGWYWHRVWCTKRHVDLSRIYCVWILDAGDIARRENIAVREKWETTHPPTSHLKELPAMLEMVFASRYVVCAVFLRHCNVYVQLPRVLYRYRYLWYETKLSTANHTWQLWSYVLFRVFCSNHIKLNECICWWHSFRY